MRQMKDHRDDFELWLQESVDSLKMYPAYKVWFSLYNHLHPSRKFPSTPVAIFMFCWMLWLQPAEPNIMTDKKSVEPEIALFKLALTVHTPPSISDPMAKAENTFSLSHDKNIFHKALTEPTHTTSPIETLISEKNTDFSSERKTTFSVFEKSSMKKYSSLVKEKELLRFNKMLSVYHNEQQAALQKNWDENTIKPAAAEGKFSYQLYAGSMVAVSYPIQTVESDKNETAEANERANTGSNKIGNIQPGRNWEAGGGIVYRLSSLMQLKAGFQLNYRVNGQNTTDENMSKAMLPMLANDPGMLYSSAINSLPSRQYQFSLPIGADLKLAGDNVIQWYAGATVQPSFSMQQADNWDKSLDAVDDQKAFLKNWNLNGGLETFLSVKLTKGVMFNAGPQFRYQLYSSLKNNDLPNERIYNVGLKFGISSSF